jgi:Eco57I restriction-modification methylase
MNLEMLSDDRLRSIEDYLSASDVFPGVGLKGGVCYFLWNRDHRGLCQVRTHFKDWPISTATRALVERGADVFIRFNEGLSILKKVMNVESAKSHALVPDSELRFDRLVSSLRPFGFRTFFRGRKVMHEGDVVIYQNGGPAYVARDEVATGIELIDEWKIYVGRAAPGTGNRDTYPHRILSTPFIGEPGSICSETYLCIGPFKSKSEAESALSYLACRLTRMLILLHKPSQDTTRKVYTFVPKQDWSSPWTDAALYAKYAITQIEIDFIEKIVRPMDLTSDLFGDVEVGEGDDE